MELSKISENKYFGVISIYEKDSVLFSGFGDIQKNLFSHPQQDFFMHEKRIENKPLINPVAVRIPASFFKTIETVGEVTIQDEKNLIKETIASSAPAPFCFEKQLPLNSKIVSQFGSYRKLATGMRYFHTGLDLRAWTGTTIQAMGEGQIVLARGFQVPGNAVYLNHGNNIFSKYFHMSALSVEEGQRIQKGQELGKSGATGRVEGPHLHWEVSWRGISTDPQEFVALSNKFCTHKLALNP